MPFKSRRLRRSKRRVTRRRVMRRRISSKLRRIAKQRGGGHKEDLIDLITSHDNFPDILEFFQGMEGPIWHADFPKKDGDDYILLIQEGEAADQGNDATQKLIVLKMKKLADHFAEVEMATHENKAPKDFIDQYQAELLEQGEIYTGIRDASVEIFGIGR
jgi:hypothetical protein